MNLEDREKVYQQAVHTWGAKAQMEMAIEEAIEFALAIRKQIRKNNNDTFANLIEEFADLEIMMEQINMMHSYLGLREMVNVQKDFKINRLKERLHKDDGLPF